MTEEREYITGLALGYRISQVLFASLHLRIFNLLEEGAGDPEEPARKAGADGTAVSRLLTVAVALKPVEEQGGFYCNAGAAGVVSPEMEAIARKEDVTPDYVRAMIGEGKIVVAGARGGKCSPAGIGKGLSTKVNASIGTSSDIIDIEAELRKARTAEECGADTLMELSVGGDHDRIRREFRCALYAGDARNFREGRQPADARTCTMCGQFCANEWASRLFKDDLVPGEKK